tara:strand:- start:328 stop:903 length:576 start_codon:yes stop_codon:yes gene_type:complete
MRNTGHRLGASGTNLENTIEGLKNSLENHPGRRFRYWEFDVRESSEGSLFVFHDDHIRVGGSLVETHTMNFGQIYEAGLAMGREIPLFSEVCRFLGDLDHAVMVEIKHIFSEKARSEVLDSVSGRENWKVMATPKRFEMSFPTEIRNYWAERFDKSGVKLVRVGRHRIDLFKASKSKLKWNFARPSWLFGL